MSDKETLRLKAIENQMRMDFSKLMIKYSIYDQMDLNRFMSEIKLKKDCKCQQG